jgi:L-seryl-tRNA(Ser) seleniumtransferase
VSSTSATPAVPAVYERLGISPVVNGAATLTRLGGSVMPPAVVEAMVQAAGAFVPLDDLHRAAGRRLAELTRNEAAYVSSGAAAGLVLATAACITGTDAEKMALLPRPEKIADGRHKVVVFRSQRNGYDFAIRQVGVELVEVGPTRAQAAATPPDPEQLADELFEAIDERTACVTYFAGGHYATGALPIEKTVELAHQHGVPVVVDAAAQIPPIENLWRFSGRRGPALWAQAQRRAGVAEAQDAPAETVSAGADLAVFSGGKGLCGPQPSGLIVGRADLIDAIGRQGSPNALIGRPMKVGKEEICGLVAAVEWSLSLDFAALAADYERQCRVVLDALAGVRGVEARRDWPNEAGQPLPRVHVRLTDAAGLTRDGLQEALRLHRPRIELSGAGGDGVYVNPQTLKQGEAELIAETLRTLLGH